MEVVALVCVVSIAKFPQICDEMLCSKLTEGVLITHCTCTHYFVCMHTAGRLIWA